MTAVMGIGRFVYTPILPFMVEDLALQTAQGGVAAGFNFLGYLLGALSASATFFERKISYSIAIGLLVSVLTTALSGFWLGSQSDLLIFYTLRFVGGFSSAIAMIFASSLVMKSLQSLGKQGYISLHFAGVGAGIILSSLLVSSGAAYGLQWSSFWYLAGFLGLMLAILSFVLLPNDQTPQPKRDASTNHLARDVNSEEKAQKSNSSQKSNFPMSFWLLVAGYGFFGFGYSIMGTFINTIANLEPELRSIQPHIWLIVGLAVLPSAWIWYKIGQAKGLMFAYISAILLEAIGIGIAIYTLSPATLIVAGVLLGFTFMAVTALSISVIRYSISAQNLAKAFAFMTASFGLGQMIGPILAGFSFELTRNFDFSLWLSIIALLIAAILSYLSKTPNSTQQPI